MNTDQLFEEIRHGRELITMLKTHEGSVEATIKIPDISDFRFSVWGDWGPMYTVHTQMRAEISLSYRLAGGLRESTHILRPEVIRINSPMLADEREQYPLFLEVSEKESALRFRLYYDKEGRTAHGHFELSSLEPRKTEMMVPQ